MIRVFVEGTVVASWIITQLNIIERYFYACYDCFTLVVIVDIHKEQLISRMMLVW